MQVKVSCLFCETASSVGGARLGRARWVCRALRLACARPRAAAECAWGWAAAADASAVRAVHWRDRYGTAAPAM